VGFATESFTFRRPVLIAVHSIHEACLMFIAYSTNQLAIGFPPVFCFVWLGFYGDKIKP
jgi:hypothetical protein